MKIECCFDLTSSEMLDLEEIVKEFSQLFNPIEKTLYILEDAVTHAKYIECHILGDKLLEYSTVDSPLDPDNQPEYKANRDIAEDSNAFLQMKEDAKRGRSFSNIVVEYNTSFDEEHPLKIVGGQHRFYAIQEAALLDINRMHGIKVYFSLSTEQRLDAQVISNTNIAVSPDLLDRIYETVRGPELRDWCQTVGLLSKGEDFSDRKQRGSKVTVRAARTLVINYFEGKKITTVQFPNVKTTPYIAKTGGLEEEWENLKKAHPKWWNDAGLTEAGVAFAALLKRQYDFYKTDKGKVTNGDYADKAQSYAVLSAWSYVAGILQDNKLRLKRLFDLPINAKTDPLNAKVLAKARHSTDLDNYRGLGTRTDAKERSRLAELFFLVAEKGEVITLKLADAAIKQYHAKQAVLDAEEAISRI